MKAMVLRTCASLDENSSPLSLQELPIPELKAGEVLIRVNVCGVCHTELDEIEGRLKPTKLPIVPGHQVVGVVNKINIDEEGDFKVTKPSEPSQIKVGDRVGVAWIHSACGECEFCVRGYENLCEKFLSTGKDIDGGYAQYCVARKDFVHLIPDELSDTQAAPFLCAGAIGYRSLRLTNIRDGEALGLAGFGASGHLTMKIAKQKYPNSPIFVFSRNSEEREFARSLGADWSGSFDEKPATLLNSIIDTTPAWKPVLHSLALLKPGGRLVINGIRKETTDHGMLKDLDYPDHLWKEKEIKSVANVTRQDVREILRFAQAHNIHAETQVYDLEDANQALIEMKKGKIKGAKVLMIN